MGERLYRMMEDNDIPLEQVVRPETADASADLDHLPTVNKTRYHKSTSVKTDK